MTCVLRDEVSECSLTDSTPDFPFCSRPTNDQNSAEISSLQSQLAQVNEELQLTRQTFGEELQRSRQLFDEQRSELVDAKNENSALYEVSPSFFVSPSVDQLVSSIEASTDPFVTLFVNVGRPFPRHSTKRSTRCTRI